MIMRAFEHELGDEVRDTVTGYVGNITARAEYATGPNRYLVETLRSDKGVSESWFDEGRLSAINI
jgi:hypothetical protein